MDTKHCERTFQFVDLPSQSILENIIASISITFFTIWLLQSTAFSFTLPTDAKPKATDSEITHHKTPITPTNAHTQSVGKYFQQSRAR